MKWFTSKTIIGGVIAGLGKLADPSVLDMLSALPLSSSARTAVAGVAQVAGGILALVGLRHAIAKIDPAPPTL